MRGATDGGHGTGGPAPARTDGASCGARLGFRDLVVYGLLFIAPMAPVGVFGTLDAKSHGAVAAGLPRGDGRDGVHRVQLRPDGAGRPAGRVGLRLRPRGARRGGRVHRRAGWRCSTTC